MDALSTQLHEHLSRLFPGERVVSLVPMPPDTGATADNVTKAEGYGLPVRVVLESSRGSRRELVWRTASANPFGHDRRADRAAAMIQAFDDFAQMPHHVAAVDLGVVLPDHRLLSIRDGRDTYLITSYAPGAIYADDLRRIARDQIASDLDLARCDALVDYLAELHVRAPDGPARYRRAIRDLVGSGEGIFGIIDGYPDGVPSAPPARLAAIEDRCIAWRRQLRDRGHRATRTHGDFHPFNLVFDTATGLTCLDASRGGCGDPADDLTALTVNYLLFALDAPPAWDRGLGVLWHRSWRRYATLRGDRDLLEVAPPFLAWRALVVCNPRFYPGLSAAARDKLLGFAELCLDDRRLDPDRAELLFR
jgi:aminoglycoside phosphotransferase (APT) family kinase protein